MKPKDFLIVGGKTIFIYDTHELHDFNELGQKDGNVGMLIREREGTMLTYKGYGTIEHPIKEEQTVTIKHFEPMDGKLTSDEEICRERKIKSTTEITKFIILDLAKRS